LFLTACGGGDSEDSDTAVDGDEIELSYLTLDTEIASTHVLGTVLEDLGYDVTLNSLNNAVMWESIATGQTDASVSVWLPHTHRDLLEEHEDSIEVVGPNLEGGRVGFIAPEYMEDVNSIEDLDNQVDQTIIGVEPGSGTTISAQEAQQTYDNMSEWTIQSSSSGAMATELSQAVENNENIIVAGWSPHWIFQAYDLKFLEDPQNVFGDAENIVTIAREGLEEDHPVAHSVISNFFWEQEDVESVMLDMQEGASEEEAARTFVDENQDLVDEWTADVEEATETTEE